MLRRYWLFPPILLLLLSAAAMACDDGVGPNDLEVGDCVKEGGGGGVTKAKCSPARLRVVGKFQIEGYDTFPGLPVLAQLAKSKCNESAGGIPDIGYLIPDEGSWSDENYFVCLLWPR